MSSLMDRVGRPGLGAELRIRIDNSRAHGNYYWGEGAQSALQMVSAFCEMECGNVRYGRPTAGANVGANDNAGSVIQACPCLRLAPCQRCQNG